MLQKLQFFLAKKIWNYLRQCKLPSVFRVTPPSTLKLNLNGNYPYYPNYLQFLNRPHHHFVIILCAWYTIWVLILIKSIVLSFFLAFITLSDLYYPHHPPSEGCTFRSRKKAFYTYRRSTGTRFKQKNSFRNITIYLILVAHNTIYLVF